MVPQKKYDKQVLIFMSDGADAYPSNEIHELKKLKFEFFSISFQNHNETMEKMCQELGGKMNFAENVEMYRKICFEILDILFESSSSESICVIKTFN